MSVKVNNLIRDLEYTWTFRRSLPAIFKLHNKASIYRIGSSDIVTKQMGANIDEENRVMKFKYNGKELSFHYDDKYNLIGNIFNTYWRKEYAPLEVKDKTIIDLGCTYAETAIYFVLNGAKHVYTFEPYDAFYDLSLENIKQNGLEDKISLFHYGIGGYSIQGEGEFITPKNYQGAMPLQSINNCLTAKDVIEMVGINSNHFSIKSDDEGAEYPFFLESPEELWQNCDSIIMEYHFGYEGLVNKLKKCGFKVKRTGPCLDKRGSFDMHIGIITATKN